MAVELKRHGVATISLWPGAVRTELVSEMILERNVVESGNFKVPRPFRPGPTVSECSTSGFAFQMKNMFEKGETTQLSGKCLVGLAKGRQR